MKIANTADIHLRGKDLAACDAQLGALVYECIQRRVSLLTVAGDVFDRPGIGDNHASTGAIAEVAIRHIKRLTDAGVNVLVIPGNHDQGGAGSAPATNVLLGIPGVYVVHEPGLTGSVCRDLVIVHIPWSWGAENAEQVIAKHVAYAVKSANGRKVVLLAHIQVVGARLSGSFCCDPAPGQWQVSRGFLESLPVDRFVLGDFHARQDLTGGRGGYVGALRQLTFGEEANPAGFEIFDTETGAAEWVELDAAPRYHSEMIAVCDDGRDHQFTTEGLNGDNWRVRFDGNPDPVEVRRLEAAGVRVEIVVESQERIRRAEVPEGIADDNHALIGLWAASQNPPVDGDRLARMHRVLDATFADKQADLIAEAGKMVAEPQAELVASASEGSPF
jgi:DNA repair exonuclease SbcCD nuclease subunit